MNHEEHREDFEEGFVLDTPNIWVPRIFEGEWQREGSHLEGFDTIMISLDGKINGDLDWRHAQEQARKALDLGYNLMWDLQLGLFNELKQPLTSQVQFLSLTLALEHFRDTLWKEFKSRTVGLILYQGSADFSHKFSWDDHQKSNLSQWFQELQMSHFVDKDVSELLSDHEGSQLTRLFCRDVIIEFLGLLATRLPDSLSPYLFLDARSLPRDPYIELQIINPERFDRFHLALKGVQLPHHAIGWEIPTPYGYYGRDSRQLPPLLSPTIGLCVPPMDDYQLMHYFELGQGISTLQRHSLSYKMIPESHLTSQWDGLDYLIYNPSSLTPQGKRKLQGFCAAGGTLVSVGNHQKEFSGEMNLQDFVNRPLT